MLKVHRVDSGTSGWLLKMGGRRMSLGSLLGLRWTFTYLLTYLHTPSLTYLLTYSVGSLLGLRWTLTPTPTLTPRPDLT